MDAPIRVLYAEDNPRDVDLTRSRFALEQPAFEIEIVDTGEKCWTRLQQHTYDILLLDYRLPDMDGIDLLKRLVLGGLTLPAVMVTGLGDEEIVVQALRLGAIDYIPKSDDYLATLPSILKGIALEYRQRKILAQPLAPPRRRVLYIERHQMDIDLTLSHLSEVAPHLAVTVVKSCADALQLLVTDRGFDLVLTDLRMPDMSALDFFRELKHRGAVLPFVIITGQGDEETAVAALKLGAADYIVKRQNYLTHLPYTIDQTIVRFQLNLMNLQLRQEIAERRQAEDALRESEASFRLLFANNPHPMWVYDLQTLQFLEVNEAAVKHYGYSHDEFLGMRITDIRPPEDVERLLTNIQQVRSDLQYSGEWRHRLRDGRIIHVDIVSHALDFAGRNARLVVAQDITVRKQAEEALRRSALRLGILHHIDQAMLTAQSPGAIAETALLRLRDLIPFQRADVVLFDTDEMFVLATVPLTGTALRSGLKLPIEPDWIAELQRGEPIIAHDLSAFTSQRFSVQVLEAEGMQSLVNVPLLARGQLIGVLNLAANTLSAFKPEHVDIATEVADQIAVMIQQARLHEQVQRHADELEIRVAERTRELRIANEQLKELDYAKDQFVSNVSHELRVPLANLKLYINLLERGKPEKRAEYMETLHREHGRLDKMIEDLLDLSRLDLGVTQIQPAPTDLNLLLSQLIGDRMALAAEHQLVLDYQPDPDLPMALIDPVVLIEVITNLIGNAVNYTPAGGMITVITAAREHEGQTWVTFTVQDNGLGISAKDMPHLFERFYRGEVGHKADAPGTGLGLAICKEIVDRLGGHITVESESGQGSTFTVWLNPAN